MITVVVLSTLGLIFGSFISALTWRIHEDKDWVRGRSQCIYCAHQLSVLDLVPVFSWLLLRGKCRYCSYSISSQYPLTELGMAFTFLLSYLYWPYSLTSIPDKIYLGTWLVSTIGLGALFIYDLKWMLLPSKIIYPTLAVAVFGNTLLLLNADSRRLFVVNWFASVLVASGIFFILHIVSQGRWIGFGDVRLGLITGTILHKPGLSFLMIFIASLLGTIFVLPSLLTRRRKMGVRLPYGPFLILAAAICLLSGQNILDWYLKLASF